MKTHTNTVHSVADCSSTLSGLLARGSAEHGLPTPLGDDDGGGACYPNEDNETGP